MLCRASCVAGRILRIWIGWIATARRNHIIFDGDFGIFQHFSFILKRVLPWLFPCGKREGSAQSRTSFGKPSLIGNHSLIFKACAENISQNDRRESF